MIAYVKLGYLSPSTELQPILLFMLRESDNQSSSSFRYLKSSAKSGFFIEPAKRYKIFIILELNI